ncbi:MAG: trypsin-like peptidase domain-containing protein [Planctomycetaceae bacterium]
MRGLFVCLASALVGAFLAVMFWQDGGTGQLKAQDRRGGTGHSGAILRTDRSSEGTRSPIPPGELALMTPDEAVNVAVYEKCNRSVVNISTTSVRYDKFFMMAVPGESVAGGSGFVIDRQGHLVTNYHVVKGAKQIEVTLFNEESYPAKLVGADPVYDLAVLKIEAPPEMLFPVEYGDSDRLRVGMRVFALGNPFGLDRTMSVGIVSSLNRTLEIREDWVIKSIIQIDADINPGNSGGPLFNARGQLIGINVAIATQPGSGGQSAGIGFSIPSSLAQRVLPELVANGRILRGEIGITHVTKSENGLRIIRMEPGSAAEKAGLKGPSVTRERRGPFLVEKVDRSTADIISAIDNQPVTSAAEFHSLMEGKKPGDVVQLTIIRDGRVVQIPVTLADDVAN